MLAARRYEAYQHSVLPSLKYLLQKLSRLILCVQCHPLYMYIYMQSIWAKSSNIGARTPEAVGSNMRGPVHAPRRGKSSRETFIVRCSYSLALFKKTPAYMQTESKLDSCITCVPSCIRTFGFVFQRLTMAHHVNCGSHLVRIRLQVHWNYELDLGFDTGNHYECLKHFH